MKAFAGLFLTSKKFSLYKDWLTTTTNGDGADTFYGLQTGRLSSRRRIVRRMYDRYSLTNQIDSESEKEAGKRVRTD